MASDQQLSDVLSEFARTMLTEFPIEAILDHLVKRIVVVLPITGAGVTLISPPSNPHFLAASDDAAFRFEQLQSELDEGPCLLAFRTGEAVSVPDIRYDERFPDFSPRALTEGLAAVFTFPLRRGDIQLGALDLYRDTPGKLDATDMIVAQTLADVTAAYLVNAQARAHLQDISDRSRESSLHDPLTGLPNRVLLMERLAHALDRGVRSEQIVGVLFVDLDRFKAVNDLHGHKAGDDLLIAVGQRISGLLRPGDTIARFSGDEFVLVCEDLDIPMHAEFVAKRVVDALSLPFLLDGVTMKLSASIGIAVGGRGEPDPEALLHEADVAMYQAKAKGGGHFQFIDLSEHRLAESRSALRRDLGHAVARSELRVEYQPVVSSTDRHVVGAEALLRWEHSSRGLIPPSTVIPLAEQSGLISEIGRWVLLQACTDRSRWRAGPDDTFSMAVNVSTHQLVEPDFAAVVAEVLRSTSTPPELLILEITESALIENAERALVALNELKKLGVLLALDDFGTGYSSLSYLQQYPVDIVKLDKSFVADITREAENRALVKKIIELARVLNLAVISEGVETAEQHEQITELGSEYCQGYYFARPMTADNLDVLVGGPAAK